MKLRNPFKRKRPGCTNDEQQAWEVEWYERHGKYPDRIKVDGQGKRYVQIDRTWNKQNAIRKETIRDRLAGYVGFRVTGILGG